MAQSDPRTYSMTHVIKQNSSRFIDSRYMISRQRIVVLMMENVCTYDVFA